MAASVYSSCQLSMFSQRLAAARSNCARFKSASSGSRATACSSCGVSRVHCTCARRRRPLGIGLG